MTFLSKYMTVISLVSLFSINTMAHGEDKLGPHGGHIRMPGPFHTELVYKSSTEIEIYLLDIQFQNPVIANSVVKISAKSKGKTENLNCQAQESTKSFKCTAKSDLSQSTLTLVAKREAAQGNEAIYKLPLPKITQSHEVQKKSDSKEEHQHHH